MIRFFAANQSPKVEYEKFIEGDIYTEMTTKF